jgi:predicted nucleotidyltransferase
MAKIPDKIRSIIKNLLEEAEKEHISIQKAILFGSYANGTNTEFSDIDLALVSDDFQGSRFEDNMKLMRAVLRVNSDIETHPFRPEDFNNENPFVVEILKNGIVFN